MVNRPPRSVFDFDSFMETAKPILKDGRKIAKQKVKQAKKAAQPEPEKVKGNKVKKLLFLAGLIGVVRVIARRLMDAPSKSNWQPAYTPAPAPRPAAPQAAQSAPGPEPDDTGGASPDEALSDAVAEPHDDTTPDAPVELVEVESPEEPRKPDPLTDPLEEVSQFAEPAPVADALADEVTEAPYGPDSAAPGPSGESPGPTYTVKGNKKSMIFHTAESPSYERTKAQVWFTDETTAESAGFRHWKADKPQD